MPSKAKSKILSLEDIEAVEDIIEKTVPIPAWGGDVKVRTITKREMNKIRRECRNKDDELDEAEVEKQIIITGLVEPKLTSTSYEKLMDKASEGLDTIFRAITRSSKAEPDAVKDAEKNFRS